MNVPRGLPDFPYLLAGVEPTLAVLLQQAGIATTNFESRDLEGRRQLRGNWVLFDSRYPAGQDAFRAAARYRVQAIDVRELTEQLSRSDASRRTILSQLKREIERRGGTWARIADYPFPFQSLLCSAGTASDRFQQLFAVDCTNLHEIAKRYRLGVPAVITDAECPEGIADEYDTEFPLMWRTDYDGFSRWWRRRSRIRWSLSHDGDQLSMSCRELPDDYVVALEIWRGDHVARIPLESNPLSVERSGFVFSHEPDRDPGGLASWWAARRDLHVVQPTSTHLSL